MQAAAAVRKNRNKAGKESVPFVVPKVPLTKAFNKIHAIWHEGSIFLLNTIMLKKNWIYLWFPAKIIKLMLVGKQY